MNPGLLRERGEFGVREGVIEKAGQSIVTHRHNFDHVTYLLGSGLVEALEPLVPDTEADASNPEHWRVVGSVRRETGGWAYVNAGVWHRITALRDHLEYHCIYLHRDPLTGLPVSQRNGYADAYQ